jgi:hypothetical protein
MLATKRYQIPRLGDLRFSKPFLKCYSLNNSLGTLEAAQRIAGHAESRTTKLYNRRGQKVLLEDMERIRY